MRQRLHRWHVVLTLLGSGVLFQTASCQQTAALAVYGFTRSVSDQIVRNYLGDLLGANGSLSGFGF